MMKGAVPHGKCKPWGGSVLCWLMEHESRGGAGFLCRVGGRRGSSVGSAHTRHAIELRALGQAEHAWDQPATCAEAWLAEGEPGLRGSRLGVFDPFHWARRDADHAGLPLSVTAFAVTPSPPEKGGQCPHPARDGVDSLRSCYARVGPACNLRGGPARGGRAGLAGVTAHKECAATRTMRGSPYPSRLSP